MEHKIDLTVFRLIGETFEEDRPEIADDFQHAADEIEYLRHALRDTEREVDRLSYEGLAVLKFLRERHFGLAIDRLTDALLNYGATHSPPFIAQQAEQERKRGSDGR